MLIKKKKLKKARVSGPQAKPEPTSAIDTMVVIIAANDQIDGELYGKYNVKRGLRNVNGTGVIIGLTKISDVVGYSLDEEKNKIPEEGRLYYRGYDVETLVQNCLDEGRFGFEEISYLLLMGELPNRQQLENYRKLVGEKRTLP